MALNDHRFEIHRMVSSGMSYLQISVALCRQGVTTGLSVANIRHFCRENGINPGVSVVSDAGVDVAVSNAVLQVGPTYGRRMMTGYLASVGVHAGEGRVGSALRRIHPAYHSERQQRIRNINAIPYHAAYYGHKLHMDQNEKLAMFGVTHVIAIDGLSSRVVQHFTMPIKNNLTIYEHVFRPAVLEEGMWDTVRVDHGKEFYLTLYMQERNGSKRKNTSRSCYIQSTSMENHRVERIWPEINNRVNYPLKAALVAMVNDERLDMTDQLHRQQVTPLDFPEAAVASQLYFDAFGSTLTDPHSFAVTPFRNRLQHEMCDSSFSAIYPDLSCLLDCAVNRNYVPFQDAVLT